MDFSKKIDYIIGAIVALMISIFGRFWFLFAFLLFLNVADYLTGIIKARYLRKETSKKATLGFLKKCSMWILVAIGFGLSEVFVNIGNLSGHNLSFMGLLGWFMLAHCIVNEIRSIVENIIEMDKGEWIPTWLIKGLEVAQNLIDKRANDNLKK